MKRLAACGLALLTALAITPGTASADRSSARYVLAITDEGTGQRSVTTLDCDPAGGAHPAAEAACAAIAEAGSIEAIPPDEGFCTMEYRPVTATAYGHERFEQTFGNHCVLRLAKGEVFAF
ncbi:SSI family serine proteinase inhibitor [Nocardiopsis sp. CC223A]|uniref:SSI family serine proteinase inhibitor n=1 Tax=Nocardiopsis sp. CC223A TaxID=3044051 RepID=UPI00278C1EF5|nr:SSI family serine proteinase inhibitor [Nocardiopsis sp. CC223A]